MTELGDEIMVLDAEGKRVKKKVTNIVKPDRIHGFIKAEENK